MGSISPYEDAIFRGNDVTGHAVDCTFNAIYDYSRKRTRRRFCKDSEYGERIQDLPMSGDHGSEL